MRVRLKPLVYPSPSLASCSSLAFVGLLRAEGPSLAFLRVSLLLLCASSCFSVRKASVGVCLLCASSCFSVRKASVDMYLVLLCLFPFFELQLQIDSSESESLMGRAPDDLSNCPNNWRCGMSRFIVHAVMIVCDLASMRRGAPGGCHFQHVASVSVRSTSHNSPLGARPFLSVPWGLIFGGTLTGSGKLHLGAADSGLRDATDEAVD